jgi:hypothetical protein
MSHRTRPFPAYKLPALTQACRANRIPYKFGGKWEPMDAALPPKSGIDCSGYVRGAVYHASLTMPGTAGYPLLLPDGSWNQHQWLKKHCRPCHYQDGAKQDGVIRMFYLSAKYAKGRLVQPGHIGLIQNGFTIESRGGIGPDRVKWLSRGFHRICRVYEFGVAI